MKGVFFVKEFVDVDIVLITYDTFCIEIDIDIVNGYGLVGVERVWWYEKKYEVVLILLIWLKWWCVVLDEA